MTSSTDFMMPYSFLVELMGDRATLRQDLHAVARRAVDLAALAAANPFPDVTLVPAADGLGRPAVRIDCPMPGSADVSHHPFQAEIDELVACVLEGRDTSLDVFDAQKTMEVCLAADRSAERGGTPVALPLITYEPRHDDDDTKVAIVTGAGSGIGRAVALALAEEGYDVVLAGRRAERARRRRSAMPAGAARGCSPCRPTSPTPRRFARCSTRTSDAFGRLDLLFNNAGIGAPAVPLDELTVEQWRAVVDTNLTGAFLCTQQAFRLMKDQHAAGRPRSSTTARSRRTCRGRTRRPTPRPSTRSPG